MSELSFCIYPRPCSLPPFASVIMDGVMIALATIVMNICHPGRLLGPKSTWSEEAIYRMEKDQIGGYDPQGRPYDTYEAVRLNGSDERV